MLAVVQPYSTTASPDVPHRQRQSTRSLTHNNLASSNHPPSLPRHNTAPAKVPAPPSPPPVSPSPDPDTPFDIISYPPSDLLKLLANILTHIATTNDHLSPSVSSSSSPSHHVSPPQEPINAPPIWHTLTTAARNAISTPAATLTFHARNIPTISLEAYLLRILKYCPTSNHVFLSLLVYFDRMSKLSQEAVGRSFIIDSYNIHRLVIAGITVASKFFSDVFYTNSRYAKVGGLPLPELNQLELQFLLLNDFRLVVSSADMQDYAEQLILFSKTSPPPSAPNLRLPSVTPHIVSASSAATSSSKTSTSQHLNNHVVPLVSSSSRHASAHPPSLQPHSAFSHLEQSQSQQPHHASSHSHHLPNGSAPGHVHAHHHTHTHNHHSRPPSSTEPPIPSSSKLPSPPHSSSTSTPSSSTATPGFSEASASSSSSTTSSKTISGSRTPTFGSTTSFLPSAPVSAPAHPSASFTPSHSPTHTRRSSTASATSISSSSRRRQGSFHAYDDELDADADTSTDTDAGTETETETETEAESETNTSSSASTDDEPTIRAPRTVYAGSTWGDADERMGSP